MSCEYCGRDLPLIVERQWCSERCKVARQIYDQGQFVMCLECGRLLRSFGLHSKLHTGYSNKYPRVYLSSINQSRNQKRGLRRFFDSLSNEEYEVMRSRNESIAKDPVNREKNSKGTIRAWESEERRRENSERVRKDWKKYSEDEYRQRCGKMQAGSETEEAIRNHRQAQLKRLENGTHNFYKICPWGVENVKYELLFDQECRKRGLDLLDVSQGWECPPVTKYFNRDFLLRNIHDSESKQFGLKPDRVNLKYRIWIEVDDDNHRRTRNYDFRRDEFCREHSWKVIRIFWKRLYNVDYMNRIVRKIIELTNEERTK